HEAIVILLRLRRRFPACSHGRPSLRNSRPYEVLLLRLSTRRTAISGDTAHRWQNGPTSPEVNVDADDDSGDHHGVEDLPESVAFAIDGELLRGDRLVREPGKLLG